MKAWDLPISHNALVSRGDLAASLDQLMEPLLGRFAREGAGPHIGNTSAHYDDRAALLEGASRLLWGLGPFAAGVAQRSSGDEPGAASRKALALVLESIKEGSDPASSNFWGIGGSRDQRFVEMASISLSLMIAPQVVWESLSECQKENLAAWLGSINEVELPPTNWEFFRIFVNIALRELGRDYSRERLESGLAAIDALYREDGWYIDETNYDLYNPFAFHFYGLVYAKLMAARDPVRSARFRLRARLFAAQYLPWFASDGSAVPFGRSLSYRFAAVAFFSACAFAGEEVVPWGVMKGIVLRNLRWWFARPIFDHEGLLTIGYTYPNLIAAEQYNAPGSPYWALKTYLVLALPENHPFWTSEEAALPEQPAIVRMGPPNLLACRTGKSNGEHVYFLNAGQYPCWESVGAAAKYAKFAYSNRFGFCVSHASFDLSKTGCDSSLLFSEGDGYWRERRASEARFSCAEYVSSIWAPWPDVRVRTWLLPFGTWHLRLHLVESGRELECVEGGFSLPDCNGFEAPIRPSIAKPESGALFVSFSWARGGIVDLSPGGIGAREAELHKPEPNLNILYPRVLVPILRGKIAKGRTLLAAAVFAEPLSGEEVRCEGSMGEDDGRGWYESRPRLALSVDGAVVRAEHGGRTVEIALSFEVHS